MNYEKFNDAMCRLRQAEEDFNKAIQDIQTGFNEYEKELAEKTKQTRWEPWSFDNVVKKTKDQELQEKEERQVDLQAQIDEAYNKGLQDLYDALCIFSKPVPEMREIFDSVYIEKIILKYSPKEIIDKVNQWKTEKDKEDQELHVGDEIEYTYPGREPEKCIVINLENGIENEKIIWTIRLDLSQLSWFSSNCYWGDTYYKTGKHYDSIPLKKEDSSKRNEYRDQEFHIGDEVKHEHGRKGIITNINDNDNGKTLWITYKSANGFGFDYCWIPKDTSEKTGRHFDSIPFDYQQEEEINK